MARRSRVVGECVVNNGDDHFGFSISGANAEYFVAKAAWLHRIPDELSFVQGAFVEPFSVAYTATVAAGGIDASDRVAVIFVLLTIPQTRIVDFMIARDARRQGGRAA